MIVQNCKTQVPDNIYSNKKKKKKNKTYSSIAWFLNILVLHIRAGRK